MNEVLKIKAANYNLPNITNLNHYFAIDHSKLDYIDIDQYNRTFNLFA